MRIFSTSTLEQIMTDEINYQNNPLHALGLKDLLLQLVDQYGFELLNAYVNINCFETRPTIESSLKFLKKTEWAREKLEVFYLYTYKSLPRPSSEQFALPPRDRVVPNDQKTGEPKELSFEDAAEQQEKRDDKAEAFRKNGGNKSTISSKRYNENRDRANSKKGNEDTRENSRSSFEKRQVRNETSISFVNSNEPSSDASSDPWGKWKK